MRWRPILVSAVLSGAAALALVMSESAMMGAHVPHTSGGGQASVPKTDSGTGTAVNGTFDTGQSPSGAFGGDPTTDSPPDQQSTEQPDSGQSGSGAINPLGTVQQLVPKPGPVPITR